MTVTVESRQVFTYYIYTIICIGLIHKRTQMLIKQNMFFIKKLSCSVKFYINARGVFFYEWKSRTWDFVIHNVNYVSSGSACFVGNKLKCLNIISSFMADVHISEFI